MDYSQLSDEELIDLYNKQNSQPDYSQMSNEELMQIYNQQPQQQPQQQATQETKKGIDLTPSGLIDKAGTGLASLIATPFSGGKTLSEVYQEMSKQPSPISPAQKFATDLAVYSTLGGATGLSASPFLEGAVIGGLEGLKEGNNPLASAVAGGATGSIVSKGAPLIRQGLSKVASGALKSGIPSKLASVFADITPETVKEAVKNPKIIKQGKSAGLFGQEKYYSEKYSKLGKEYLKNLKETTDYIVSKINEGKESFKNVKLNVNEPDFNKLLMEDLPSIFQKESDVAYSAIENNPDIKKTLYDYYRKTLYDNKPTTLHDLNKFKEKLVQDIKSKYGKVTDKYGTTSRMDNEEKIVNEVERTIDKFLKARNPELANAQTISKKMLDLQKELGLSEANIGEKIQKYNTPKSIKSLESERLEQLQDMFLNKTDTLKKSKQLQAQQALNRLSPETSGMVQILTRKALPYLGMGTLGFLGSGMNPLGFMGGLLGAGVLTSPKSYGKLIQNLSEMSKVPTMNPQNLRLLQTISDMVAGKNEEPTRLLEGRVEKSNLE